MSLLLVLLLMMSLQALFEGTQSEGVAPGTSILVVIAMDADQTGTPNAEIEFSLLSGDVEAFNIDRDTGVISNRIVLVSVSRACSAIQCSYAQLCAGDDCNTYHFAHCSNTYCSHVRRIVRIAPSTV